MQPATWIFGLCVAGAAASQQRATLLELYDATGGSGWANASGWATAAADECAWHGVTCAGGRVVALDLVENGLDGLLPALGGLGALEELFLAENVGLSANLTSLKPVLAGNLTTLDLGSAEIVGGLPDDAFADAPHLDLLRLASESLAGERLPSAWPAPCVFDDGERPVQRPRRPVARGARRVRWPDEPAPEREPLHGRAARRVARPGVPRAAHALRGQRQRDHRAGVGGAPLDAVASLPALTYVFAKSQRFNGTLPNFGSALRVLNLENNDVDALADDFGRNMSACETLSLVGNRLATLPESWAEADAVVMPELLVLSLAENAIAMDVRDAARRVPVRMHRFSRLMVFDLSGNLLTGDLDAAYDSKPPAETLRTAKLARNALTGSLPAPANLPEVITTLDLSDNDLEGAVWSEYANLENLYVAGNPRMGDDALPVFLEADRSSKVVDEPSGRRCFPAVSTVEGHDVTIDDAYDGYDRCSCAKGYVLDRATGDCEGCAAGTYDAGPRPGENGEGCSACYGETSYADERGLTACKTCPANSARAWTLLDAGVALDECVCLFGYYSSVANASYVRGSSRHATWGLPGVDCLPCPDGASCLGYGHAPLTRPNHWAHVDDPTRTAECRPGLGRCAVNAANCRPLEASMIWGTIGVIESDVVCADVGYECAEGYGNTLCERVSSPGYYKFGYYNPEACPDEPDMRKVFAAGVSAAFFVGYLVLHSFLETVPSINLIIYFLQLAGIVLHCKFPKPDSMHPFGTFLNVLLLDLDVLAPTCWVDWSPADSLSYQLFLAAGGFARYVGLVVWKFLWRGCRPGDLDFEDGALGGEFYHACQQAMSFMTLQHAVITFKALRLLPCDTIFRRRGFAAFIVAVVGVGLPLLGYVRVWRSLREKKGVHDSETQALVGYLVAPYHHPCHNWHARRALVAFLVALCATNVNPAPVQLGFVLVAFARFALEEAEKQPHSSSGLNSLANWAWFYLLALAAASVGLLEDGGRGTVIVFQPDADWRTVYAALCYAGAGPLVAVAGGRAIKEHAKHQARNRNKHVLRRYARSSGTKRKSPAPEDAVAAGGTPGCGEDWLAALKYVAEVAADCSNVHLHGGGGKTEKAAREYAKLVAAGELAATLHPWALGQYLTDPHRSPSDIDDFFDLAEHMCHVVDDASPTSVYSGDHRATFWREFAQSFGGAIDFVVHFLTTVERQVFFSVLTRLQEHTCIANKASRSLHYAVAEEDRSSVLYYLLCTNPKDFGRCADFLKAMAAACRDRPPPGPIRAVLEGHVAALADPYDKAVIEADMARQTQHKEHHARRQSQTLLSEFEKFNTREMQMVEEGLDLIRGMELRGGRARGRSSSRNKPKVAPEKADLAASLGIDGDGAEENKAEDGDAEGAPVDEGGDAEGAPADEGGDAEGAPVDEDEVILEEGDASPVPRLLV
ncbi:hypothetical protein JL721_5341 [Aureococcus anophagefferens]|nr:hypothetical protein JL721_5341 [Aureococcus anophagefferens]